MAKAKHRPAAAVRVWAARVVLMLVTPVVLVGGVEAVLRLAGYGYQPDFLVPAEGTAGYTTNEKFLHRFYPHSDTVKGSPFLLKRDKPAHAFRIFILGESAALGTPNPAFGFGRIWESMLRDQFPSGQIEIYNAALRGVNSHIILPIARECARFEPDLFVVYMGNNELAGLHGAQPDSNFVDRHLALIRLSHWLKGTRLGQLALSAFSRDVPAKQDMPFYRAHRIALDDPRRQPVYAHFQANLEDMLKVMLSSGAKVLLCTVPTNLRDCPPVGSLDPPRFAGAQRAAWESAYAAGVAAARESQFAKAVRHLEKALAMDGHSANLHYWLARSYAGLRQFESAQEQYLQARDWDALPLRADGRLNQFIRELAGRYASRGVILVDAEQAFQNSPESDHGISGRQLFSDHVHLRFAGDYLLAQTVHSNALAACSSQWGPPAKSAILSIRDCADQLAYNDWEDLEIEMAAVAQMSRPPFLDWIDHQQISTEAAGAVQRRAEAFSEADLSRVKASYQAALGHRPGDWQVHLNFGVFLMTTGDHAGAVPHLEVPVRAFPGHNSFRIRLADALAHAGRRDEAIEQLREVLRRDPKSTVAMEALGVLSGADRKNGPRK